MERLSLFLSAVISGISSTGYTLHTPVYKRPAGTDLQRMRGDWERVGDTMRHVINREKHGSAEEQATGPKQ